MLNKHKYLLAMLCFVIFTTAFVENVKAISQETNNENEPTNATQDLCKVLGNCNNGVHEFDTEGFTDVEITGPEGKSISIRYCNSGMKIYSNNPELYKQHCDVTLDEAELPLNSDGSTNVDYKKYWEDYLNGIINNGSLDTSTRAGKLVKNGLCEGISDDECNNKLKTWIQEGKSIDAEVKPGIMGINTSTWEYTPYTVDTLSNLDEAPWEIKGVIEKVYKACIAGHVGTNTTTESGSTGICNTIFDENLFLDSCRANIMRQCERTSSSKAQTCYNERVNINQECCEDDCKTQHSGDTTAIEQCIAKCSGQCVKEDYSDECCAISCDNDENCMKKNCCVNWCNGDKNCIDTYCEKDTSQCKSNDYSEECCATSCDNDENCMIKNCCATYCNGDAPCIAQNCNKKPSCEKNDFSEECCAINCGNDVNCMFGHRCLPTIKEFNVSCSVVPKKCEERYSKSECQYTPKEYTSYSSGGQCGVNKTGTVYDLASVEGCGYKILTTTNYEIVAPTAPTDTIFAGTSFDWNYKSYEFGTVATSAVDTQADRVQLNIIQTQILNIEDSINCHNKLKNDLESQKNTYKIQKNTYDTFIRNNDPNEEQRICNDDQDKVTANGCRFSPKNTTEECIKMMDDADKQCAKAGEMSAKYEYYKKLSETLSGYITEIDSKITETDKKISELEKNKTELENQKKPIQNCIDAANNYTPKQSSFSNDISSTNPVMKISDIEQSAYSIKAFEKNTGNLLTSVIPNSIKTNGMFSIPGYVKTGTKGNVSTTANSKFGSVYFVCPIETVVNELAGNFIYRPISLTNPFPDQNDSNEFRNRLGFWGSKQVDAPTLFITQNREVSNYDVYNLTPMYTITLTPTTIKNIRTYNNQTSYQDFNKENMQCTDGLYCQSQFLKDYADSFGMNTVNSCAFGLDSNDWYACDSESLGFYRDAMLTHLKNNQNVGGQ